MSDNPTAKEIARALEAVRSRYNSAAMLGHGDAEDLHTAVSLLERLASTAPKSPNPPKKKGAAKKKGAKKCLP